MPRELEDKLIDAWEAAGEGDFGAVMEQLGPFTVNTRTPALGWSPLMVACGLSQVCAAAEVLASARGGGGGSNRGMR